ncbi:MAG: hypothetical protein R8M11_06915 [Gallionella sp.]
MPQFTDLTGLLGVASAICAIVMTLPRIPRLSTLRQGILLSLVFVLAVIPFGELPLAAYVRGATGDLSITTLVLIWGGLLQRWCGCISIDAKQRDALLKVVALVAVFLYPLSLGVGMFDPYRYGFGCEVLIFALLTIALAAWIKKSGLIVLCIALASLAWSIGWYESNNLWDYLIDPFLAIYALWALMISMKERFFKHQLNGS